MASSTVAVACPQGAQRAVAVDSPPPRHRWGIAATCRPCRVPRLPRFTGWFDSVAISARQPRGSCWRKRRETIYETTMKNFLWHSQPHLDDLHCVHSLLLRHNHIIQCKVTVNKCRVRNDNCIFYYKCLCISHRYASTFAGASFSKTLIIVMFATTKIIFYANFHANYRVRLKTHQDENWNF